MTPITWSAIASALAVPAFLTTARRHKVTLRPLHAPIVLPANQMVRLIKRECARIDRNGLFCALAVFTLPEAHAPGHGQRLLNALSERARLTDVVGWLDQRTACVFLTDSTLEGATVFANAVKEDLATQIPKLSALVHNYDGKWAALGAKDQTAASYPIPALALSA